ncbi:hypothetical protein E2C01_041655 [Portunus trituberculatus]|uniref:Uncharacterized protein n=1 Tax=Portunus trituberculatus TaxID=210409 RepID=A0A5B7FUA5_PORTR|nr:hypothetical protein [Portunus trituberculatus]
MRCPAAVTAALRFIANTSFSPLRLGQKRLELLVAFTFGRNGDANCTYIPPPPPPPPPPAPPSPPGVSLKAQVQVTTPTHLVLTATYIPTTFTPNNTRASSSSSYYSSSTTSFSTGTPVLTCRCVEVLRTECNTLTHVLRARYTCNLRTLHLFHACLLPLTPQHRVLQN